MKQYDIIVVGSGIAGLTAARILAQHGKRILLLEKASILGGSLARFRVAAAEGNPVFAANLAIKGSVKILA